MAKTNWGAGLSALGQGLEGIAARMYAERRQREQQELYDQRLADEREYEAQLLRERLAREDEINTQRYGPVIPQGIYTMPGVPVPTTTGMFGGMRVGPGVELAQKLYPQVKPEKPADPQWMLEAGGRRTLGFGNPASFQSQGYDVVPGGMDNETGMAIYRMIPRPMDGGGSGGGGAGKQPDIPKAAEGFTERALGPSYQRVTQDGVVTDYSYGGFALPAPELGAMPPEYRRMFEQAAADSMTANPAYINPSNQPALAQGIYQDIGIEPDVNLAPPFLPEGWQYNDRRGEFRSPDANPRNPFRGVEKMRAVQFFREKLLPQVEPGGVTQIELKKLIKMADDYGLDDAARRELGLPAKGGDTDTAGF